MIVPGFIFDDATHVKPPAIGVGLRLYGSSSSYVGLISPATGSGLDWILPGNAGSNGNVLTTDGAHTMSWAAAGGASGANPTASVILSAVNGSASTFMRSDGAPALSQAIAPTWTGAHAFALTAGTGTQSPGITFTGAAHTALTASTESNALNLNCSSTKQWATGALTTQREILVQAPTYGFVAASTITTAVTQEINGAPIQGTNATITNQIALRVLAGVPAGIPLVLQGAGSQTANLLEFRNSSGTVQSSMDSTGQNLSVSNTLHCQITDFGFGWWYGVGTQTSGVAFGAGHSIGWRSATTGSSSFAGHDLGLARNAAGVAEINNGTAGAFAALRCLNISYATDAMTYASTISLDVTKGALHTTTTVNATGNATINASAGGNAGQVLYVLVTNDATSAKTITFGTNFKPSATVVGTQSKSAMLHFMSDGTNWYEVSRTLAL